MDNPSAMIYARRYADETVAGLSYDEMYSVAHLAELEARAGYDPKKGTLAKWINVTIYHRVIDYKREITHQRRLVAAIDFISLETIKDPESVAALIVTSDISDLEEELVLRGAHLDKRQRHIVEQKLAGESSRDVAQELNITEARISQILTSTNPGSIRSKIMTAMKKTTQSYFKDWPHTEGYKAWPLRQKGPKRGRPETPIGPIVVDEYELAKELRADIKRIGHKIELMTEERDDLLLLYAEELKEIYRCQMEKKDQDKILPGE